MAGSSQGALPDGAADITLPADCRAAAGKPAGAGDDSLLAAMYMRMWALASGRPLPRNVPPGELTEEELVSCRRRPRTSPRTARPRGYRRRTRSRNRRLPDSHR